MSIRPAASFKAAVRNSRVFQTGLLAGFWLFGQTAAHILHLPLPGGVVGLFAALLLLASGRLRLDSVRRGANLLLAEMLLFFVPAVMAVLDHREFVGLLGLKVMAVILTGTLCVMAVTALVVDLGARWSARQRGAEACVRVG
ncbi:CidA/LrgA family protein [Methylocella sp.]|uniref:CidA/LrgA family protein n=1 Tax=Methylocella sp. TaxID=1978226 RepID=UPI003784EC46